MASVYLMEIDLNQDIIDQIQTSNLPFLKSIFHYAQKTIDAGGIVRIVEKYDNADTRVVEQISTKEKLGEWENRVSQILINMKKV